ncbi:MAG: hypothetical protein JEZ08_00960 [Clostridiales bacterium]|nr:hypothetical protein [Clostridiales bacterium]
MEVLLFNLAQLVILFFVIYFVCKMAIVNVMSKEEGKTDKLEDFIISLRDLDYIDNERMESMIAAYRQKRIKALSDELFEFEENDFEFNVDNYIRDVLKYIKRTDEEGIV